MRSPASAEPRAPFPHDPRSIPAWARILQRRPGLTRRSNVDGACGVAQRRIHRGRSMEGSAMRTTLARRQPFGPARSVPIRAFVLCTSLAITACRSPSAGIRDPGPDHPASPRAAEAALPGVPGALSRQVVLEPHPAQQPGAHEHEAQPERPPTAGQYVCPMHPAVVSDRPGTCPICKMDLEPVTPKSSLHGDSGSRKERAHGRP